MSVDLLISPKARSPAEAHAHQIPPEKVHFHEVGAVDTLVDILGVCYGLDWLGVRRLSASPLPWFSGSVSGSHLPPQHTVRFESLALLGIRKSTPGLAA